jgi:hypothetical protein
MTAIAPFQQAAFSGLIGIAREDITPPVGIYSRMWGAAEHDVAEGIHRPLTLTALTLQANADESPYVLVGLDVSWWRRMENEWNVRGALLNALKLDPSRVMINLLHTHAGPSVCIEHRDLPGGKLIPAYIEKIKAALISAVKSALAGRSESALTWTTGLCDVATNRDLPDPAKPRNVVGFNPLNAADTTVLVGRVTDRSGRMRGTIINYACHPVTLAWQNRLISPDYAGAMREVVEGATAAPSLFLQGASGELAPREQYTGDTKIADSHGKRLGYAVLSALEGMLPADTRLEFSGIVESGAPLGAWQRATRSAGTQLRSVHRNIDFNLKDLPTLEQIDASIAACTDRVMRERLHRKRGMREDLGNGASVSVPYWVWRVGDAFIVGQPNEAYSLLQRELRRRFPGKAIAVMNLVNGGSGYLPEAGLYGTDMYTVNTTPFERGSLERLIDACAAGIGEMMNAER